MVTNLVDVSLLAEQAFTLLETAEGVDVADGEVHKPRRDDDGRIHPLATFYPSPGRRFSDRFSGTPGVLAWAFQVTCAGGDRDRALWCVHQVTTVLTGQRLTVDGRTSGLIKELGDPGSILIDNQVKPPEFYTSIDFGLFI